MACRCMRQFCFLLLPVPVPAERRPQRSRSIPACRTFFVPLLPNKLSNPLSHNKRIRHRGKKKNCLHDIYIVVVEKINLHAVVSHDISTGNHLIVTITSLGARRRGRRGTTAIVKSFTARVSRNSESRD